MSTSLLDDLTAITVDPAYVAAAARRAQTGEPDPPRRPSAVLAAAAAGLGLLVVVAARETQERAPAAATTRSRLVERVQDEVARTDRQSAELERLRAHLQSELARTSDVKGDAARSAAGLRELEQAVGAVAVTGPGLTVRLSDAARATGEAASDGRIQDRDIQDVVNALWAAGAEAVAVDDQRVGPLTAIRQAGDAVLVDYRPVSSPYDVVAVGDPARLDAAFGGSAAAGRFRSWSDLYGLGFSVARKERLEMPAIGPARLREAASQPTAATGEDR
jgi:uncharacterized protein YlxW (UPF0749 family)